VDSFAQSGIEVKILFLSQSGQLGGAERSLLDFLASLRNAKPNWSLHLILPSKGDMLAEAEALGVNTSVVSLPKPVARLGDAGAGGPAGVRNSRFKLAALMALSLPYMTTYVLRLRSAIAEISPDLIHSNGLKADILSYWAKPSRIPLIWHIHDYTSARPVIARLLQGHAKGCSIAIANSETVASDLRSICPKLRVNTIYNAVDLDRFAPDGPRLDLDALAGKPPAAKGTIKVGLVATMARWKGQEVFLRAMSMIPESCAIRGYVVGGPLYETDGSQFSIDELRATAAAYGVTDRVGFTGFIRESSAAMRSLHVVVHASTQPEPFGLVVTEAMALGKAVISSRGGGVAEIVTEGLDGLSHEPGDAAGLAKRITRVAACPELRSRLGRAAIETTRRRFERSRLAADLIRTYREAGGIID
jgi:glycosyltransferase involved in cell wall biosynthesis